MRRVEDLAATGGPQAMLAPGRWRVIVAAGGGLGVGVSLYGYVSSLFIVPLERAFGWSRAEIAAAMIALPVGSLCLPLLGSLVDRFGARMVAAASALFLSLGYVGLANIGGGIAAFYAASAILIIGGLGTGPISYARMLADGDARRRGRSLAFGLSVASLVSIAAPLAVASLIAQAGWRAGYLALSALALTALPMLVTLGRQRSTGVALAESNNHGGADRAALRTTYFWRLCAAMFCGAFAAVGLVAHLHPLVIAKGVAAEVAPLFLGLLGGAVLVGRLATGLLLDRYPGALVGAAMLGVAAAGAVILASPLEGLWISAAGVLLLGIAQGAESDLMPYLIANRFGLRSFGKLLGGVMFFFTLGVPAGAISFGWLHDRQGTYSAALLLAAVALSLGALLLLSLLRDTPARRPAVRV